MRDQCEPIIQPLGLNIATTHHALHGRRKRATQWVLIRSTSVTQLAQDRAQSSVPWVYECQRLDLEAAWPGIGISKRRDRTSVFPLDRTPPIIRHFRYTSASMELFRELTGKVICSRYERNKVALRARGVESVESTSKYPVR